MYVCVYVCDERRIEMIEPKIKSKKRGDYIVEEMSFGTGLTRRNDCRLYLIASSQISEFSASNCAKAIKTLNSMFACLSESRKLIFFSCLSKIVTPCT